MKDKNNQIEGLRGAAASLVVVYHVFFRFKELYLNQNIGVLNYLGGLGAITFLILSAYLISGKKIDEFSLLQWYKKKFVRLWPLYAIAVTVIFALLRIFQLPEKQLSMIDYLLNLFCINGFIGAQYVDGAHWYITTLISLIVIVGVLKKIGRIEKITVLVAWLFGMIFIRFLGSNLIYKILGGGYAGIFVCGISLFNLLNSTDVHRKRHLIPLVLGSLYTFRMAGTERGIECIIAMIIVALVVKERLSPLNNKVLVYIGGMSYSLYLIHQQVAYVIEYNIYLYLGYYSIWCAVITFFSVFILGDLFHRLVEKRL